MHLIYRGRVRMKWRRSPAVTAAGYTLIEFMVAITLSLLVLASLTAIFISSMRARDEVERANQQVESGRYAAQLLMDDLQMAGYYGEFDRSEEHTSELQSLMRIPYAVFCLQKKKEPN